MDLYTLDKNFLRTDVVDDFNSVIWTERYTSAGDVTLIVPLTRENILKIPEGSFLATPASQEVMLIESALIEKGQLKLTGSTLVKFLNNRVIRATAAPEDRYLNVNGVPGILLWALVNNFCMPGTPYTIDSSTGIDGPRQVIPNLSLDTYDTTGAMITMGISYGPLYDGLVQIAQTSMVGFTLYLASASTSGYSLKFKSYRGRDLTSGQSLLPIVRFSSAMDSLTEVKELRSIAGYKNVAYAFAPANPGGLADSPGVAYTDVNAKNAIGFDRRIIMVFADDITTDLVGGDKAVLVQLLTQRAKDALANNNYVKMVDGELVPQSQFQYGRDYGLGDIIELQGPSGLVQNARITEYIRAQDSTGEREYPTVSVID